MASGATFHCAAFIFREPTPNTRILTALNRPLETLFAHIAPDTNLFRLFDLGNRRASVAYREEELWVLMAAGGSMAPIHGHQPPPCGQSSLVALEEQLTLWLRARLG
jgi:hypothetical protein